MAELLEFQRQQLAFAAHIRDPHNAAAPEGIEDRRLAIYRELFFNNLCSLLTKTFPVLSTLMGERKWQTLIRRFMQQHRAATPYFLKLPEELLAFLEHGYKPVPEDFPFLLELAHYEYIELALNTSTAQNDLDGVDPDGDLAAGAPVKSVLAWVYAYRFPVHRISPDYLPEAAPEQPTYLTVYRNRRDKLQFLELNPLTAGLLDAIDNNAAELPGQQLIRQLAGPAGYADVESFLAHGLAALKDLRAREILIGTRRANAPPGV